LAQEEHVLSWAIDAQLDSPHPSTTVETDALDPMQAEAAVSVAGDDRLVLVAGPAGAGKTTMLSAAVHDLTAHGRPVFGVAPTAKAARVLETETGMACDTVAKLLHEWNRSDRPPDPAWRLPVGTTLIVDEAGMLATGDLCHLTLLADQQHWRLVLVGDPRQLQAVTRGGMFAELCATGHTVELDTVHRFRHDWEAAASLKLRHGDPAGLAAYLAHDRIIAAPLAEHLEHIARLWAEHHAEGRYTAITTTTNDHVHAINNAIQQHRREIADLGDTALNLGDGTVYIGEIVVTRHNDRQLRTLTGDSVRNRDYWTVDAITADGGLTVTRIDGHGTITLPADYVRQYVQLGYAATEPGNQAETADRSLTLATPATTCRGLYVAITRGRDDNHILVVTDSHNVLDAIDTLQQILTDDRADTPAVGVRRELAGAIPPPPKLQPRCQIPDWFHDTYRAATDELAHLREKVQAEQHQEAEIKQRITELGRQLRELAPRCAPHDHAIASVQEDLDDARQQHRQAERALAESGYFGRRAARNALTDAADAVTTAETALGELSDRVRPLLDQRNSLRSELEDLRRRERINRPLRALDQNGDRLEAAQHAVDALDVWRAWAAGHTVHPARLLDAATDLSKGEQRGQVALAHPLVDWLEQHGIIQLQPTIDRSVPRIESPGLDIDF
jgi:hypothetical protein